MRNLATVVLAISVAWPTCSAFAAETTYGDIVISSEIEPHGSSTHGYSEYVFVVVNRSKERDHHITLDMPKGSMGGRMGLDYLRSTKRTFDVPKGTTARVSLFHPDSLVDGSGVRVSIDGREEESPLPIAMARSAVGPYRGYGMHTGSADPLILTSNRTPVDFHNAARTVPQGVPMGGMGIPMWVNNQIEQEKIDVNRWSGNWLGYSRYDAVVVTADELKDAPENVRTALWQYAETGGVLVILGDKVAVPESWKQRRSEAYGTSLYGTGFGHCLVAPDGTAGTWNNPQRQAVLGELVRDSAAPWQQQAMGPGDANRVFRVVENVQVPVRGLFALMCVFTFVIGPLNLWLLDRGKRRIWMLWTVPLISFVTCLAVFGYMIVSEGWRGQLRTEVVTILDENTHRATTYGWTAFYAPLTPGDGLHFSPDTELMWLKGADVDVRYGYPRRSGSGSACRMDWTKDQHLTSGWVTARVPCHFKVRKSEPSRLRLTVERGADGAMTATNGLGANAIELYVADDKGRVYRAQNVAAGARATLQLLTDVPPVTQPQSQARDLLRGTTWLTNAGTPLGPQQAGVYYGKPVGPATAAKMAPPPLVEKGGPAIPPRQPPVVQVGMPGSGPGREPLRYLAPRTYIAVLDGAPFLEDGLTNLAQATRSNTVLGILRETDDAR